MSLALARSASSVASRRLSGRQLSTAKLHKAKDLWPGLKAQRPIDHDDEHHVFHPPFNKVGVVFGLVTVVAIGWGTMAYGFIHQQYKQGFYK